MSAPEKWTADDTGTLIRTSVHATPQQRDAVFLDLLAAACAIAEHHQNQMMIGTLREIYAKWGQS